MITINLKPGTKRARGGSSVGASLARVKGLGEKIKDPYRVGALVIGAAWLGFVGFSHVNAAATLSGLEPKLEQARAENQRFRAFLAEKRRLEAVRDSIQTQIATIREVDGDRYVWPHILDEVARAVPSYTWLTDIAVMAPPPVVMTDSTAAAPPPPPVQIQITGRTIDIQGYTRLLRQLEDSPFLTEVTAVSANTVVEQDRAVTAFVLKASYQRPVAGVQQVTAEASPAGGTPQVVAASVSQPQEN